MGGVQRGCYKIYCITGDATLLGVARNVLLKSDLRNPETAGGM